MEAKRTKELIPITKPYFGPEEAEAVKAVIESGWVTQGPVVAEFEKRLAQYCEVSEAVAVSNCTAALHLSLLALGISSGDEVICPSMSFIATANSICHAGGTPVFADVNSGTYNLDPDSVEAVITSRTKAIMVVHQVGLPADIDAFLEIGSKYGIPILEDAACAIGSRYKSAPIGGHSEMACFSFHPRKVLSTGEGGAITTNNVDYARQLRLLRQHGMSVPDTVRHGAKTVINEEYLCLGYNYRMTDIQAAVGIEQIKKLDWIIERRRELADRYNQALAGHAWLQPPVVPSNADFNYQSYAVQLTPDASIGRDELMIHLLEKGVASRRGIMLSHLESPYANGRSHISLPQSVHASQASLLLPLFPSMTSEQQDEVIAALFGAVAGNSVSNEVPSL